ncbi:MAG TPA: ATP-binding protein [Gaiellaceae bacterium]|nr:ATP-binding protein [Gaiellaceae bacterium]
MSRLPIRVRLTVAFAFVMGTVLFLTGLFLYVRLGNALDTTIEQSLRGRADDVAALVREGGAGLGGGGAERLTRQGESFAQVLDADGTVRDASPSLRNVRLLSRTQFEQAQGRTIVVDRSPLPGSDEPVRLLATPVESGGGRFVVVVGASLEPRADALEGLLTQLLIGGPLALLLSALAGYGLAAAALRPVESMRREAEAVSATEPGRRLPLPRVRDEIGRLGETLNAMLGRLEAALERERRFVSDASHELRTPLAALRAELELVHRRRRTPEELESALRSAAEETDRLSQLAEDLLVLARAQGGELPVRPERLRAEALLAGVRERFVRRAAQAGRSLEIDADGGLELSADRLRTEQALGNLVENALRHGRGRIVLLARRRNGHVELHVRDEGPGFAPGFLEHAFEPFRRADAARSGPGAGLGLAIVDVIARAHGGAAHAANREGGADAWLELPDEAG